MNMIQGPIASDGGCDFRSIIPRGARLAVRFCRECGHPFYPQRVDQEFCDTPCRKEHHQRRARRGTEVYDLVMTWRRDRIRGAFSALTQTVSNWLAEDRTRDAAHKAIREAWKAQQKAMRQ